MPVTVHPRGSAALAEMERWRECPVAIAVDLGRDVGQVDPLIRPLCPPGRQPHLLGRAVTVSCEPPDFGAVLYALECIEAGDVLMIAAGGDAETAMIGEILGGHVRRRGGVGIVCDGAIRDVATLASFADFSVFTRSITPRGPLSAKHGVVNGPVVIGGCSVEPGDLVIGDDDGLAVLSPSTVRDRIADAEARLAREAQWIAGLETGAKTADVFDLPPASVG
jgi:4-hydroxy-4-methyl-2-oxoglutarate aldolase